MAQNTYTIPQGVVEVWPYEGGPYYIQGRQLLSVMTNKNIREDAGQFIIELAPGGPFGPNQGPTWVEIITPMSLVIIGMTRGTRQGIPMVGLALVITEVEEWPTGNQTAVTRKTMITGQDFGRFFSMTNWLTLFFLGGIFSPSGESISSEATLGAYDFGLIKGRPDEIATRWFTEVMSATMSKTYVLYHNQQVTFPQFMAYWFEQYPSKIPMSEYFMASEGNWIEKFRQILQFPWYEFFVITAPQGFYTNATGGFSFTLQMFGEQITAETYAIGRVNPLPWVPAKINGQSVTYGSVDLSKWNELPLFMPDCGFIKSEVVFNDAEVRNFYIVNPIMMQHLFGQYNDAVLSPFLFQNGGAADFASIVRYGYRPEVITSRWFSDPAGQWAQEGDIMNLPL
jgi:hypothetical protein